MSAYLVLYTWNGLPRREIAYSDSGKPSPFRAVLRSNESWEPISETDALAGLKWLVAMRAGTEACQ